MPHFLCNKINPRTVRLNTVAIAESNAEKTLNMPQMKLEKKFGQSPVFISSALLENGGVPQNVSPASLLKEAVQVISCGYEDKTEWGKEVSKNKECQNFF